MSARKAHNTGRNHIQNVRDYFASLGNDTAQNIIDQIVQSHEHGGRAAMMAAPSMRLGAGFMNPMAPGMPSFSESGGGRGVGVMRARARAK
jgi:U1 small nuclear ribonucleoprotein C